MVGPLTSRAVNRPLLSLGYIWPNYTVGLQQAKRYSGLVLDHEEHGPLRGRKSGRIVNGLTVLWAFSGPKEKTGWYRTMKGMGC